MAKEVAKSRRQTWFEGQDDSVQPNPEKVEDAAVTTETFCIFSDYLPIFFASLHVEEKIRSTAQAVKIRGEAIFFGHTQACTILLASLALNVAGTKVIYPHRTVFFPGRRYTSPYQEILSQLG